MAPITTLLAPALVLVSVVLAQDRPNTKPAISPSFDFNGRIEFGLVQGLPTMTNHWVEDWNTIHILDWCKDRTLEYGFSPNDVDTWNVHYDDCNEPWIMCRHRGSSVSKAALIDVWSRIPLGMREFVRHVGVWPNVSPGAGAVSAGDNIAFAAGSLKIYVAIHEVSHSLDSHALTSVAPAPFSTSSFYKAAYGRDSAVATEYGRTSWPENFAETGIIAVYDRNVAGGISTAHSNPAPVQNQMNEYANRLGNTIIKSRGKTACTKRLVNGNAVLKNNARIAAGGPPLPDTSFKTPLEIIPPSTDNTTYINPL